MKKIEAAVFDGAHAPELVTADLVPPGPGEVRVKLVATGICHTDVKGSKSGGLVPHPVVLGHEGAGHVDAVGDAVTTHRPGDPVVLSFASCGVCATCSMDQPAYCHHSAELNFSCDQTDTIRVDGMTVHSSFFGQSSFATYANVEARHVVRVRHDAPLATIAPIACGVQTGAGAILNVLKPQIGSSLVVFGVGSVGLSAVMAASLTPATKIVAVDTSPSRLELACNLGATHALEAGEDLTDELTKILGAGADLVLDTTGVPDVIRTGLLALAPLGVLGYVTSPWGGQDIPIPGRHMLWGRKMVGIIQGSSSPHSFIPALIDLVMAGRFDLGALITEYPFSEISQAFADMQSGKVIKPVLRFDI